MNLDVECGDCGAGISTRPASPPGRMLATANADLETLSTTGPRYALTRSQQCVQVKHRSHADAVRRDVP